MARGIDTKCIHLEEDEGQCSHYGALSYPIYQTATYAHPGVGPVSYTHLASVLLLSVLVFYISRLAPGDPLVSYYGDRVEKMTPEERAWAEEKLGLKDPISVQYIRWAGNALHGDFGISYKYKMDVTRVVEGRIGRCV